MHEKREEDTVSAKNNRNIVTIQLDRQSDSGKSDMDNLTNETRPLITGRTATPLCDVELFDGEKLLGVVRSDDNGNYAFRPESAMMEGTHHLMASVTINGVKAISERLILQIDTSIIVVGILSGDSDGGASLIDNVTSVLTPKIMGVTDPDAEIVITDASGRVVGQDTADERGSFEITTIELNEGDHMLHIEATDAAGNIATDEVHLTIDISDGDAD